VEQVIGLSKKRAGRRVLVGVGFLVIFPKARFLTKYDQMSESKIHVGEVNVQHRARNEALDQ